MADNQETTTTLHEKSQLLPGAHPHQPTGHRHLHEDVPLYSRPRQRQRWNDTQILPHVNWGDLFFDLFYVAAAFQLGVIMKESPTFEGLLYFFACYLPVFAIWNEKMTYDSRFAPEDNLFHRGLEIFQLAVLGTTVQHIRPVAEMKDTAHSLTMTIFAASLSIQELCNWHRHYDIHYNVDGGDEARHAAAFDILRKIKTALLYLSAALVASWDYYVSHNHDESAENGVNHDYGNRIPIYLLLFTYLVDTMLYAGRILFYFPIRGISHKDRNVPLNLEFVLHRLGEWVMLMLGESVLALLIVEQSAGLRYYLTFYAGLLTVTMFQYLFFRSQPFAVDDHAFRRSVYGGFLYYHTLCMYSASLILVGCSYKLILHNYLEEEEEQEGLATGSAAGEAESSPALSPREMQWHIAHLFSWSMAASFVTLDILTLSHRGILANLARMRPGGRCAWVPSLIMFIAWSLTALTATMPWWMGSHNLEMLSLMGMVIVMAQVLLRTRGLRYFPVSKDSMSRSLRWPNVSEPRSVEAS